MSGDIYNQTDEQRVLHGALNTAAGEWEAIATEAETVTETPEAERTAWQGKYSPTDAHAAKMSELKTGAGALAAQARSIAASLRTVATGVLDNATVVDENNAEAEAHLNSVDTDLPSPRYEI